MNTKRRLFLIKIRDLTGPRAGRTARFGVRCFTHQEAIEIARRCHPHCLVLD